MQSRGKARAAKLFLSRLTWADSLKGLPENTGIISYTPSPKVKPRSKGDTFASSKGTKLPDK